VFQLRRFISDIQKMKKTYAFRDYVDEMRIVLQELQRTPYDQQPTSYKEYIDVLLGDMYELFASNEQPEQPART